MKSSKTHALASLVIGAMALISCSARTTTAPSSSPSPGGSGQGAATQQMVFEYWPAGGGQPTGPNAPYEVAVMNLDGTNLKQLTSDGKQKFLPHFSPDGKKVLYTKFAVGGYGSSNAVTDVAAFDLASGKETMITSGGNNGYGTWSPDGNRIAYLKNVRLGRATGPTTLMTIGVDGSNPQTVGAASGAPDDWVWVDIAWSRDNWILFGVGEKVNGAFCKSRLDKIRPDGTSRTQVSDGGPNCTPPNKEANGDADAGWSSDGKTIYSSRGLPGSPAGPASIVSNSSVRRLYAFSSDAWIPRKVERDLSLPSEPDCIEGVPKGSPDGTRVLLYRACFDTGKPVLGIYVTDTAGSYRTFVTQGFGPDWNPVAKGAYIPPQKRIERSFQQSCTCLTRKRVRSFIRVEIKWHRSCTNLA